MPENNKIKENTPLEDQEKIKKKEDNDPNISPKEEVKENLIKEKK